MLIARFAMFFGGSRDERQGGGSPLAMLAFMILGPVAAMLIQMAISRQREFAADRGGAEIVGSPMGLATALRRIEAVAKQVPLEATPATAHMFIMNPFSGMGGVAKLFMSHPPTEERIAALMAMRGGRA
jgi:heat shock protein HtpX